jgi:predicted Rossmann fold nucleotide-binding protein DprA/Smf involved in DNA uptake
VLWALGRAELLSEPSLAIVGARIASAAGQRFARQLATELGGRLCRRFGHGARHRRRGA